MLSRKEAVGAALGHGNARRFVPVLHTRGLETMPKGKGTAAADGYIGKRGATRFPISHPTTMSSGWVSGRLYSMRADPLRTSSVSK
jgi:hypothetical protein